MSCGIRNSPKWFISCVHLAFIHRVSHVRGWDPVNVRPVQRAPTADPSTRELFIQIPCDVPAEVRGCSVMLLVRTSAIMFEEGRRFILRKSGINVTCQSLHCLISWSPVAPHHTRSEKRIWRLVSALCAASWARTWEFLVLLTQSRVSYASAKNVGLTCMNTFMPAVRMCWI
jgi:hypothetical protein